MVFLVEKEEFVKLKDFLVEMLDGYCVEVCGNIGIVKDCDGIICNGGEGVGLYCIEFLFMDCDVLLIEEE